MFPDVLATWLLYQRPTIGQSLDIAATQAAGSRDLTKPGWYIIQNMGPKIAYIRMANNLTDVATTLDMPIFPYGSGDKCSHVVQVGLRDVKELPPGGYADGYKPDAHILHYICASTETAVLRVTRITKD
jgi:hypothetical protein